jgi:hypothetical protein
MIIYLLFPILKDFRHYFWEIIVKGNSSGIDVGGRWSLKKNESIDVGCRLSLVDGI